MSKIKGIIIEGKPLRFKRSKDNKRLFLLTTEFIYEILTYSNGIIDAVKREKTKKEN